MNTTTLYASTESRVISTHYDTVQAILDDATEQHNIGASLFVPDGRPMIAVYGQERFLSVDLDEDDPDLYGPITARQFFESIQPHLDEPLLVREINHTGTRHPPDVVQMRVAPGEGEPITVDRLPGIETTDQVGLGTPPEPTTTFEQAVADERRREREAGE